MSILNVDKIQPIGGGSTITVDATDIQASTGTIRASTFSGDVSATGIGVTSLNITGVTTSAGIVQAAQFKLLDNAKALYGDSGDLQIYHSTNSLIQNGTGSLQIVTTTGDLFLRGQDNITFNTAGNNERLRIDSSGRVLIGTTTVGHSTADDLTIASSGSGGISIRADAGYASNIHFADGTTGDDQYRGIIQYHHNGDSMRFFTNATEKFRIDSSGRVLIGTTTEGAHTADDLTIAAANGTTGITLRSGTGNAGNIYFSDGTSGDAEYVGFIQYYHADNSMRLATNNTERLRIASDGTLTYRTAGGKGYDFNSSGSSAGIANIFCPASYTIAFGTNNTERLRIDTLGIHKITTPGNTADGTYYSTFTINNTGSSTWSRLRFDRSDVAKWGISLGTDDKFRISNLYTDGSSGSPNDNCFVIADSGKIGINETSPQQQLHVHDDTAYNGILINGNSAPRIAFARSTTTTGEWSVGIDGTNGNNFVINRSNDNSNRYVVISNGQINLNQNTSISGILYNNELVSITSTNDDSSSHVSISARNAAGGYGNYCIIGVSGNTYFGAGANSYSSNPSGNNINGGTTIRVYGGISSNAYQDAHRFGRDTDGSIIIFQSAGGTEGSIAISGSTTNYNTSSDYRLKENIVNITDGITRLKQLKPRRFNFIKDPSITKDGFIAHEVDSIVPEAVTGTKDETFSKDDEANNVKAGDPKYQHMDSSKLIPLLTAALQEAITEIETLKTKVAALEGS